MLKILKTEKKYCVSNITMELVLTKIHIHIYNINYENLCQIIEKYKFNYTCDKWYFNHINTLNVNYVAVIDIRRVKPDFESMIREIDELGN